MPETVLCLMAPDSRQLKNQFLIFSPVLDVEGNSLNSMISLCTYSCVQL
jgi:glutaminase